MRSNSTDGVKDENEVQKLLLNDITHSAGKIIRTHCVKNKHQANGIFKACPIIVDVK